MNREGDPRVSVEATLPKVCPSCRTRYPADALFCAFDGAPLGTSPAAMAAAAANDPYIGHEIVGPIEIRQLVGIGAMGRVYRGFQRGIDRDVAVKILHRELSANPTVVARFHREAKVASRLAHPNVVHVLLTGQLSDGAMYIVMEYLDGMSLQSALAASGGAMPLPRALHIAAQLCDAVGEAHAQGIVHRDLKPENVMLVKRADDPDFVKVLDFGIARLNWGEQSMATAAGVIFGTARYISPEAAQGEKVTPAGDVYSIAMMLYQMLAGRTAFEADQAVALLVQQIHDVPPHLKTIARASYVPDSIAEAVMQNLAKRPEGRAENGRELGRSLLDAAVASGLSAHDILARPGMSGGARGTHASSVQMASLQRTQQPPAPGQERSPGGVARTVYDVGAPPEARSSGSRGRTPPAPTEMAEPSPSSTHASAPGTGTVRWSPPKELVDSGRQPPSPSSVDSTMDEQQQPRPAAVPHTVPARPLTPVGAQGTTTDVGQRRQAPAPSHEGSAVTQLAMVRDEGAARRRTLALFVACFLVGVVGMAMASKAGLLGARRAGAPSLEAVVTQANDALLHQRWDSPRGDNVRDLTDDGLIRWPHEPELLRIRALACNDIVKVARARREEGSMTEASHLAKLAYVLDPSDDQAQKLAAEVEIQVQSPPNDSVPPLANSLPAPGGVLAAAPGSAGPARVTLDASNAKPGPGQPVDFVAHVTAGAGRPRVEGAAFRITGPGVAAGAQLDATEDSAGAYRVTFTFLQPGRFEVVFAAKADGAPVRATRLLQVGAAVAAAPEPKAAAIPASAVDPEGAPAPASSGVNPATPSPSAKWL